MRYLTSFAVVAGLAAAILWFPGCQTQQLPDTSGQPGVPGGDPSPNPHPNGGGNPSNPPAPASFTFVRPASGMTARGNQVIDIAWNAGDPARASTVSLTLVGPGSSETAITSLFVDAGIHPGALAWTIPANLPVGSYKLRGGVRSNGQLVAQVFASGTISVEPQTGPSAQISIVSPAPNSLVRRGELATIVWNDSNAANATVDVKLQRDGKTVTLARSRPASGSGVDDTVTWDTTLYPEGVYQVSAELRDAGGALLAASAAPAPLQVGGNVEPDIEWVFPNAPISINEGTPIILTWRARDPDNTTSLMIEAVPIGGSGSSVLVTRTLSPSNVFLTDSQSVQTSQFDNGGTSLGDYGLRATISDGVNPPTVVLAPYPISILARPDAPPPPPANQTPTLVLDQPSLNRTVGRGVINLVSIQWRATDDGCLTPANCNSGAILSIYADPDAPFSPANQPNGNERVLVPGNTLSTGQTQFTFDAGTLPLGTFTIYGVLNDGINPPVIGVAPGRLNVVPRNQDLSNQQPTLQIFSPFVTIGLSDGDASAVIYEVNDPDPGDSHKVRLVLDKDRIANNDVIVPGNPVQSTAIEFDLQTLPPGSSGNLQFFNFVVNEDAIPPISETNALGEALPYNLRLDLDDGFVNPFTGQSDHRTSLYAPGGLFVLARIQARPDQNVVDLRQIGRTVAGVVFTGIQSADHSGAFISRVADSDADGTDDLMIGASAGEGGGSAYLIFGSPFRYSGLISLNSVGITVPGWVFTNPENNELAGSPARLSSAAAVDYGDADGPLFVFGAKDAVGVVDRIDDDPVDRCDCDTTNDNGAGGAIYDRLRYVDAGNLGPVGGCPGSIANGDGLPNSRSDAFDNGFPLCVNGQDNDDLFGPNSFNPRNEVGDPDYSIDAMGMVYVLNPTSILGAGVDPLDILIRLGQVGQNQPGFPLGTRLRGAWFESDNLNYPSLVSPAAPSYTFSAGSQNNRFGSTVAPLGVDGGQPLVVSSPDAHFTNGEIWVFTRRDFFEDADGNDINSLPVVNRLPFGTDSGRGLLRFNVNTRDDDFQIIRGELPGDRLGNAVAAGDINQDGLGDLAAGAPGATRNGQSEAGVSYVIFNDNVFVRNGQLGTGDLRSVAIVGDNGMDRLGQVQGAAGDFNGDGRADFILGAAEYGPDGAKSGLAGIVYGLDTLPNATTYSASQIGTAPLRGVRFRGVSDGDRVGASVCGLGDFNLDGVSDVAISAPGQRWPAANIAFLAMPLDGDRVTVSVAGVARTFEFDANNAVAAGNVRVDIAGLGSPLSAEKRLRDAMQADATKKFILAGRVENQQTSVFATNILSSAGSSTPFTVTATGTSPNVGNRIAVDTSVSRVGVNYIVFGLTGASQQLVVTLPDDVLPSAPGGPKLRALILVGPTPVLPGGDAFTADVVSRIGDFDGDSIADVAIGAPQASPAQENDVGQFRLQAGQTYVLYGATSP